MLYIELWYAVKKQEVLAVENQENSPAPLDNDALTRLVYLHDDEITELIAYVRRLEKRIEELEEKNNIIECSFL